MKGEREGKREARSLARSLGRYLLHVNTGNEISDVTFSISRSGV
jgi:hypothetical protein